MDTVRVPHVLRYIAADRHMREVMISGGQAGFSDLTWVG